jgi:hypothetical protein
MEANGGGLEGGFGVGATVVGLVVEPCGELIRAGP